MRRELVDRSAVVLGIHTGIDPSAALVRNGHLLSFVEEERLIRFKHASGMVPYRAIECSLSRANIRPEDVNAIALNWNLDAFNNGAISRFYDELAQRYPVDKATKGWQQRNIQDRNIDKLRGYFSSIWLKLFGLNKVPEIRGVPHHYGHAYHAFKQSPFNEAICLTIDGSGDTECTVLWRCSNDGIERLRAFDMPHSLGWFYAAFTEYLGFEAYDGEYKVMGLAAYGRPRQELVDLVGQVLQLDEDGIGYRLNSQYIHYGAHSYSGRFTDELAVLFGREPRRSAETITPWHEDLAYAVQHVLETTVCRLVSWAVQTTGIQDVCLGGGVCLNVKMNSKIFAMNEVKRVFAHPLCSDSGSAAAAALAVCEQLSASPPERLRSLSLGHVETNETIEKVLVAAKLQFKRSDDIARDVSREIASGAVVGWFQGGMEAGPRALGNRSILADPRFVENRDKVNAVVKFREYWRPFCPSIAAEAMPLFFDRYCDAPFMIVAFEANDLLKSLAPAIVHVDGSVRVQAVEKDVDPLYHRLLTEFGALTGIPVLLNTSFNVKGEPIVCTASDAIRTFWATGLDLLAIGDFIVEKPRKEVRAAPQSVARTTGANTEHPAPRINRGAPTIATSSRNQVLFVGAHPDDIEIGAGGTLAQLVALSYDVFACVATDEPEPRIAARRRRETLEALGSLGLPADRILFLGMRDADVSVNRDSVAKFRHALARRCVTPRIVFTHTEADSHNDHRAVRELVHATFRRQIIAGFPVINSLNESCFTPSLRSDIAQSVQQKARALLHHASQVAMGRIDPDEILEFGRRYGEQALCAEVFDLSVQYGAPKGSELREFLSSLGFAPLKLESEGDREDLAASWLALPLLSLKSNFHPSSPQSAEGAGTQLEWQAQTDRP